MAFLRTRPGRLKGRTAFPNLELALESRPFELKAALRNAVSVRDNRSLLDTLRVFKKHPIDLALVLDGRGRLTGVVTRTDLLEAIAGDLPDLE
jgi:CBS domain containing-hemolysin-like protein